MADMTPHLREKLVKVKREIEKELRELENEIPVMQSNLLIKQSRVEYCKESLLDLNNILSPQIWTNEGDL